MQPRSLPTYWYASTRCYVANSYIGKSVHLLLGQTTYTEDHVHSTFDWPTLTHHPKYTRWHTNYFSNTFQCSLTSSAGSPVQLQVLWNTSNDHKHLLAARYTEYTTLNYHKNVFTDVYVYWNSWKFKPVFTQTAPLWITLKFLHWCVYL